MSLAELQRRFAARVRDPSRSEAEFALGTSAAPAAERVGIYVHAYRARAVEALATDFPTLQSWLGGERFTALVDDYLHAHPSHSFTLRDLGAALPAFLRGRGRRTADRLAHELAAFEWALCHAFDAPDVTPLEAVALAAIAPEDWPDLHFTLQPALRRLTLTTNAVAIWQARASGEALPAARHVRAGQAWVVWRQDLRPMYRALDAIEIAALDTVCEGASFGGMCSALAARLPDEAVPLRAAEYLQRWVAGGLVVAAG
ncbi:MAG: putative DNA-binding domain-containing protein [Gammaproteobacteria bacterium]|nr:putative DNA-binding domain-containing protein [Gammaproteobacteria bacterium]